MTIAGFIFVAACAAAVLVASASTPRDPGLGMKVAPLLGMGGGVALLVTFWLYIKAKGRSGWWMLVLLPLSIVGLGILAFLTDRMAAGEDAAVRNRTLRRFLSYLLLSSAQLMIALVAVFSFYLGWMWWEGRQLKSLCAEANEGVAVSALPGLAEKYGFGRRWVEHGVREGNGGGWVAYVPSITTIGEIACEIHYDETRVLSARVR